MQNEDFADYVDQYCEMNKENIKQRQEERKRYARNKYLQKVYGIDLQWYHEVLESQNGVCAICNQPETVINYKTKEIKALAVDHDHKTGQVRRLLCTRCNIVIGSVEDSPELLRKMAEYLEAHNFFS